jgi:hypothetical protein
MRFQVSFGKYNAMVEAINNGKMDQALQLFKINDKPRLGQVFIFMVLLLHGHVQFVRMAMDIAAAAIVPMNGMRRFKAEYFGNA